MKERELLKYGELGTKDYIPGAEILEAEENRKEVELFTSWE